MILLKKPSSLFITVYLEIKKEVPVSGIVTGLQTQYNKNPTNPERTDSGLTKQGIKGK